MRFHQASSPLIISALTHLLLHAIEGVEILRPRGVAISKASLYNPDKDFTCLDGTFTIPFLYVNDDYCDCLDGSDEPGTPACPNGTFHCTNAGHRPLDIPSSRVNDGICDCCDASDEFHGKERRGGGFCSNTCLEMGRAAREEAQRFAELQRQGSEMRKELARRGREMQAERSEKLTQLRKDREEAEALKAEREASKSRAEELENAALSKYREAEEVERQKREEEKQAEQHQQAVEVFRTLDTDQNGRLSVPEVMAHKNFDQNRDGQVTDDEARFFLGESEEVSEEEYVRECWPRMKPFYLMEAGLFTPTDNTESSEHQHELEEKGESTPAAVHSPTDQIEPEQQLDDEEEEEHERDEENYDSDADAEDTATTTDDGRVQDNVQYDEETLQLIEAATNARHDYEEADRALRDVQREARQLEEALEKDYGPDHEFSPLDGECFEYTDREYIYKLCPFDQASQRPKAGGSETRLGTWGQWTGPENNKHSRMMYDRGQGCWNGPQRSTDVVISCGIESQLVAVSEPNRCEYKFEFLTPAACRPPESGSDADHSHDEL